LSVITTSWESFKTCLIGIPYINISEFGNWTHLGPSLNESIVRQTALQNSRTYESTAMALLIKNLNKTMLPPQELELLGSDQAGGCWYFSTSTVRGEDDIETRVSPQKEWYQDSFYCNDSAPHLPYNIT